MVFLVHTGFFGGLRWTYTTVLIGSFEILALTVWLACVIFLIRRNILKLKSFSGVEMTSWPKSDANYILITEILLMTAFLLMNAADAKLQALGVAHYTNAGAFPVSQFLQNLLPDTAAALDRDRKRLLVVSYHRYIWLF